MDNTLTQDILSLLSNSESRLSALEISRKLPSKRSKQEVNSILYNLLKQERIHRQDGTPPKWYINNEKSIPSTPSTKIVTKVNSYSLLCYKVTEEGSSITLISNFTNLEEAVKETSNIASQTALSEDRFLYSNVFDKNRTLNFQNVLAEYRIGSSSNDYKIFVLLSS